MLTLKTIIVILMSDFIQMAMSDNIESIAVFGATGQVGLGVINAIDDGVEIRALTRNPEFKFNTSKKINVVIGDVLNKSVVLDVVKGVDAVVVALGTKNSLMPTRTLSNGMANILDAMKEHGVSKVSICLSTFLLMGFNPIKYIFYFINQEHQRMLDLVKKYDVNYIAVFPPHIMRKKSIGYNFEEFDQSKTDLSQFRKVSNLDLGEFMYKSVLDKKYFKKNWVISSKFE